jgi:serine phosphatase RsbU (regulator of sigma subunit)
VLVAAVDCTGHGVPGALMSIVGNNILNQSINEHHISKPSAILDELNKGVTNTLRQKNEESKVKDGMDIVLLAIDFKSRKLEFSGANNPLYLIREGALTEIKGNKFPIGIFIGEEQKHFTNHDIDLLKGDTLYLFTDGYADQFGGPKGKKFKYNQFKETLLKIQPLPINQQRETLYKTIKDWQGEAEQVDDILVIGIKIG